MLLGTDHPIEDILWITSGATISAWVTIKNHLVWELQKTHASIGDEVLALYYSCCCKSPACTTLTLVSNRRHGNDTCWVFSSDSPIENVIRLVFPEIARGSKSTTWSLTGLSKYVRAARSNVFCKFIGEKHLCKLFGAEIGHIVVANLECVGRVLVDKRVLLVFG